MQNHPQLVEQIFFQSPVQCAERLMKILVGDCRLQLAEENEVGLKGQQFLLYQDLRKTPPFRPGRMSSETFERHARGNIDACRLSTPTVIYEETLADAAH